ncbi:CWF19-like protein 2 [Pollicipes pollicipes]|uniref:CWF19-like protein 2 n=1 Tax=Pollicipes pollicipes TaxID=41117 RepID=UPI0018853A79|nr:CWF19-like protein 2 [Pollicipes pollicipes]
MDIATSTDKGKQYVGLFPSAQAELHKDKQHKKKKKKKKHKQRNSSPGSDSSSSDQWVEKPTATPAGATEAAAVSASGTQHSAAAPAGAPPSPSDATQPQRDEWMSVEGLFAGVTSGEVRDRRRQTKQQARAEEERQRQQAYEALKWRDPGDPPAAARPAADQGRPLDEVVAERWGSMEKLQAMLDAAERRSAAGPAAGAAAERPAQGARGWRRGRTKDGAGGGDERRRRRSQERSRSRSRERKRSRSRERRRSRSRERRPSRSRERRRSGSRERRRSRSREKSRNGSQEKQRSTNSERRRSRSRERRRSRSRERRRSGSSERRRTKSTDRTPSMTRERRSISPGRRKPDVYDDPNSGEQKRYSVDRDEGKEVRRRESKCGWSKTAATSPGDSRIGVKAERRGGSPPRDLPRVQSSPTSADDSPNSGETDRDSSGSAKPLTDGEMNALAAKILKAELNGDDDVVATLQRQLDAARRLRATVGPSRAAAEQVVIVVGKGTRAPTSERPSKRQKPDTHRGAERTKYFADDDRLQLRDMFERERRTTPADEAAALARLTAGGVRQRLDDDHGLDDVLAERAGRAQPALAEDERQAARALAQHRRAERCDRCLDSRRTLRHLIAALGAKSYLALPAGRSLTAGHCLLVPQQHVTSLVGLDEDAWEEVQRFRAALVAMFATMEQDVVFFESAVKLRTYPHAVLQAVPVPRESGDLAPIYFKKALEESETEWSQNKKVVDLRGRDVRRAVPKGLPYFFVDFGLQPGFAHVVEDEELFPATFAEEVIGGMLELEPSAWRRSRNESLDEQRKKVMEFSKHWGPHDFTKNE